MLEVNGLRVSYGGIQAVRGISFHVDEGEMVALIGANGAGKSSTLRALARLVNPVGGNVRYRGKELLSLPAHQLVAEGIALVPEGRGIFPRMTTSENLRMGAFSRNDKQAVERDLEHVFSLFPRLAERAQQVAGTLSGGEQQMLAIGRALMSEPKLMLLDEPSMGLAPIMVQKIFEVIRTVASQGMTILLIEQNAKLALEVSQRGYVMESGTISLTEESAKLLADPKVRAAYLGE
ncbi:MAG TPA: ABC transporter ATP-binding protein [Accumulibacter sp.]|uniref:ABC transporter ATP-binding protein n=3 Tax=Accumulibacter sp. TaxID=2053492 RepID=UPI002878BEB4|nr:ABC transporter ATP-binding protein [Accumulibacter sp.]MDS4055212.1 ABC transporter ATP-binding protein [Accumulibacter sp.]HMW62471.1 ABC transporter ATP-binding protein [Accumulibacter sp.]HMW79025.1 ABC transporter ATP-binding protein [Accumulibacter sp.]HMX67473.1 ABC transporter ATP-binding protein [Accumulibacter sp.]HNB66646.1 ABC transporter ATP-binding protein [Accumulibacter sp.]